MRTNAQTDEPRACLPPLTAPSKPHFIPPPLACDSHMHLFGDPAKYKFDPDRSYMPPSATVRDIDRLHGHIGIARCVIVQASVYGMNHGVMLEAMRAQPSRFRGVAVLRADTPDSLIDELHEAGVRGFRVNLFQRHGRKIYRGGAGLEDAKALAPRLRRRGWHVQAWLDAEDLPDLAPPLFALGLDVVVDHMGRITADRGVNSRGFSYLCDLLAAGKLWCKLSGADRITCSGSPFDDAVPYGRALMQANPKKVIWGTDWPHVNYFDDAMPDDGILTDLIPRYAPTAEEQALLLVINPATLYEFSSQNMV